MQDLNEQLSACHAELKAKDLRITKQVKVAEDAISGWEKTEAEMEDLKNQLDNTLTEKEILEENIRKKEETIDDYMKKLAMLKKEYEEAMLDAAHRITLEQGKIEAMQETISEKNNRIAALSAEINRLLQTLEEVNESRLHLESSLREAKAKIDSVERTNSSLRYELCMVQKEVEIRTQEREFDHKSATAAHKQHLESVKKIAKLEAECQRLRVLVKKRLPGPAALAKMKTEVETLGYQSNSAFNRINHTNRSLVERFSALEEENKVLKDTLAKKNGELQAARAMNPRTCADSRASSMDVKIEDDRISCAESGSWASALVAELDNFKAQKHTSVSSCKSPTVMSELSLLDDFVEMEKLAHEDTKSCVTIKEEEPKPDKEIVDKSVMQVVEFLEGIIEKSVEHKYTARAFLWESKGLKGVLQNFIIVCNDFINERAKVDKFVTEFGVTLDWVVNHCFSLQDVSEMREAIVKDFGGVEANYWNGLESLLNSPCQKPKHMRALSLMDMHKSVYDTETGESTKDDSEKKRLEEKEKIGTDSYSIEHASSSKENMRMSRELKVLLEEEKALIGDCKKRTLSNEVEIQGADSAEATSTSECHRILEEELKEVMGQEDDKHVNMDSQISSASEKLAECQETITSIGEQLKLLASPIDSPLFDKLHTPISKEVTNPETVNPKQTAVRRNLELDFNATDSASHKSDNAPPKVQLGTLALVPRGQPAEGSNLLRKLLMRRKRESFKKLAMPVVA